MSNKEQYELEASVKDKSITRRFALEAKSPDFEKGMVVNMKSLRFFRDNIDNLMIET